jgi:hypothetical protein
MLLMIGLNGLALDFGQSIVANSDGPVCGAGQLAQ